MANKPHPPILIHGRTTTNINTPIQVDSSGVVAVSSSGGGGGGDASAANQTLEIAAINKLNAQILDLDSGAGTANTVGFFIALPASGGPVAGGTTTNPVNVALPAATVTTLTPPSNTGYALDASLTTIDTDIKSNIVLAAGTHVIGHVIADTGSTTAVTQATAASLNATVVGTGTFATQSAVTAAATALADGSLVTLGLKADAKSTATDTTSISAMSVLKQISASVQAPPSQAVTNTGTFAVQAAITAASGSIASGALASGSVASGAVASGAVASGAFASGSIAAGAVAAGATSFVKLEDVASADADAGVPAMAIRKATPANTSGTDGDYEMLQMSAGHLWTYTGGSVATNVAIADNPLNLGAQAVSSENAAVTTARQVQLVADLVGKLIVLPYANPENFVSGAITSAMSGTTTTSLIAAPASGLRNYITQITVSNAHATVGTDVIIQDGSGGTTLYTIPAAAVYGGATVTFPVPLRQPTTATAIFCANVTTGASTKVSASGYKGA